MKYRTEIHQAAHSGNEKKAIISLKNGSAVNARESELGLTPLMVAAASENAEIGMLRLLLEKGADINAEDYYAHDTALYYACDSLKKFKYLLEKGALPFSGSLIERGIPQRANIEVAAYMLQLGYDPTQRVAGSPSRLFSAALNFEIAWLRLFHSHGISFGELGWSELFEDIVFGSCESIKKQQIETQETFGTDIFGRTPFMTAICTGNLTKASALLSKANVQELTEKDLNCAILSRSTDMLRWLLSLKLPFDQDLSEDTPLMFAAERGDIEAISVLLENGADLFKTSESGEQAIDKASTIDCVKALVAHGADINRVDGSGMFLLLKAVETRNLQLLKGLIDLGADVNNKSIIGKTALHQATNYEELEAMQMLITAGADPNAKEADMGKWTPLAFAKNRESALILLKAGANPYALDEDGTNAQEFHKEKPFVDLFSN